MYCARTSFGDADLYRRQQNVINDYVESAKIARTWSDKSPVKENRCLYRSVCHQPSQWEAHPNLGGRLCLISYGTGAIMAVPAHDERDHAFASKFDMI